VSSIRDRISSADGKRAYVRSLFATIANRYDLITVVLSYGQDRRWKRHLVGLARPGPDAHVLDLATGTGDIALAMHGRAGQVVGLDVTRRMIEIAIGKAPRPGPLFLVGDMMELPFPDASFDLVTTGYGLRNVPDLRVALDEILRVLKPGGQALSLDFDRPRNGLVRALYLTYLNVVGSTLGALLHLDPDTYRYIPASISQYPGGQAVARMMAARGFVSVEHRRVLGGLMAIHRAFKPPVGEPAFSAG
jgi:demethylmenaquinone methyltransferase/2-methoxy-6-polyprenyl-1,4-benzoquinol methylase